MHAHEVFEQGEACGYVALPSLAQSLLLDVGAPPRLIAHLMLVHDVAVQLLTAVGRRWGTVNVDAEQVRFGAATHDIGKAFVGAELSLPGVAHEQRGYDELCARGIPPRLARFAITHGRSPIEPELELEDLMVICADKIWKGKRLNILEERLGGLLAGRGGLDTWDVLLGLFDAIEVIASKADERLAWQGLFPTA